MLTRTSVVAAVPLLAAAAACGGGGGEGRGEEERERSTDAARVSYTLLDIVYTTSIISEKCNTLAHSFALHNKAVLRNHNYFSTKHCSYLHWSCRSVAQELRAHLCWRAGARRWKYLLNSE